MDLQNPEERARFAQACERFITNTMIIEREEVKRMTETKTVDWKEALKLEGVQKPKTEAQLWNEMTHEERVQFRKEQQARKRVELRAAFDAADALRAEGSFEADGTIVKALAQCQMDEVWHANEVKRLVQWQTCGELLLECVTLGDLREPIWGGDSLLHWTECLREGGGKPFSHLSYANEAIDLIDSVVREVRDFHQSFHDSFPLSEVFDLIEQQGEQVYGAMVTRLLAGADTLNLRLTPAEVRAALLKAVTTRAIELVGKDDEAYDDYGNVLP